MQRRSVLFFLFCILFGFVFNFSTTADIVSESPFMMVFGEAGYGTRELSLGAGFRWEFLSLGLSLSGFAVSNPTVTYQSKEIPFPKNFTEEKFPGTTITVDASYYYDIKEFSIYGTLGYFTQSDSIFAKSNDPISQGSYFMHRDEKKSGICFGLGGQYFIDDQFGVGAGYHSKKGMYIQFGYYWY